MSADRSGARPGLGLLLILGALSAFASMSIDMYLPSLPRIARDLSSTPEGAQHSVAAFLVGLSVGQLIYGPLSDRIGRRTPILIGVALYLVATVGCALAPSMEALIGFRLLQALGACTGGVVSRAIVRDRFGHQESARVLSLLMLIMGVAPILAPLVGGWIATVANWRAIFGVLFVFAALVGLSVAFGLKESRSPETAARARAEHPLRTYASLLRQPSVMGYVLVGALASAAMFTYIAASPELVIETYGVPASRFGWVFGANAVGIIGLSQVNRALLKRFSADAILGVALLGACAAAIALLATAFTGFGGLWGLLVPLFFTVAVNGLASPNGAAGALAQEPARAGSVSALVGFLQFGLGAVAAAIAGVLHDGSARPMAMVIAVCLFAALAALHLMVLPTRHPQPRAPRLQV